MNIIEVENIKIEVLRKPIRNMYLRIYPPDGKVVISAPHFITVKAIRSFAERKVGWIKKQQQRSKNSIRYVPKNFLSGEVHTVFGKEAILDVNLSDKRRGVIYKDGVIHLYTGFNSSADQREKLVNDWYRNILKDSIPQYIIKWETEMKVSVADFRIKKMKTRWGTCNNRDKRIWINTELAKMPPYLLEYIVVHEMTHLIEPSHNKRFRSLMDQFLPNWRSLRKELRDKSI